eukprot:EG_transcript_6488
MADIESGRSSPVRLPRPRLFTRAFSVHRGRDDTETCPSPQGKRPRSPSTYVWSTWTLPRRPHVVCCCVLFSLLLLGCYLFSDFSAGPPSFVEGPCKCRGPSASTVPVVVSWVNVSDPAWQALAAWHGCDVSKYLSGSGDVDPFDSLRYLLRSIATHAPFLSPIILTTERNQIPSWLNTSRPDVRVVFHDEYVPAAPVFNSHPFEYRFGHFPAFNLTAPDGRPTESSLFGQCFVYMNDDFLLNAPLSPSDLVDDQGRIVPYLVERVNFIQFAGFKVGLDLPVGFWPSALRWPPSVVPESPDPHTPYVISKPLLQRAITELLPEELSQLATTSRCTRAGPLSMQLYSQFLGLHRQQVLQPRPWWWVFVPPVRHLPLGAAILNIDLNLALAKFTAFFWRPLFLFLYIPSHENLEADAYKVQRIKEFLSSQFPDPSPWEK